MVPSIVHTLISILSRFGSQFHKYHFLYCKRVGRQSIGHPLNSNLSVLLCKSSPILCLPFISKSYRTWLQLNEVVIKQKWNQSLPFFFCTLFSHFLLCNTFLLPVLTNKTSPSISLDCGKFFNSNYKGKDG